MGVINLSGDSTYRASIAADTDAAVRRAIRMAAEGADIIDVGAEATNPTASRAGDEEQIARLIPAVAGMVEHGLAVSVETYRPRVVQAALAAGAQVVNLTGREHDEEVFASIADHGASAVLCYAPAGDVRADVPLPQAEPGLTPVVENLRARVTAARLAGIDSLVVDPGIGFSYRNHADPVERLGAQTSYLLHGGALRVLGFPVLQSLPHGLVAFEEHYRTAEGFYAVWAMLARAGVLRVHEVGQVRAVLTAMTIMG